MEIDILTKRLKLIFLECSNLVESIIHKSFPVSGNIAIFAQSDEEYDDLSKLKESITKPSDNPNQKYFELIEPIVIKDAIFTHLYIRKFDHSEYGKYLGDIDFVTNSEEYKELKTRVINKEFPGAVMYDRPGWDNIELSLPNIDVVAYISTQEMAEKARVKFDNLTNL